jgi:predicted AAA+ superfamily ATPase
MESTLYDDNPHWTNSRVYDMYTPRELLPKALSYLDAKQIIALIGARRVGKSTIAKLMIKELLKSTEAKNIFFINLEKPEFIPFKNDASYLNKIYDAYLKLADPNKDKRIYFFIDEIQIFENWEIFVKSKYENSNIKFIITGSNSSLLTSNYATVLTGRVLKLQVYSFSFTEFLTYRQIAHKTALEQVSHKIEIARAKDEYLKWGGYYNVISVENELIKKETLKNIAEDIILKDIVPRYNIKNSSAIKDLFYYVVSNAATTLNYSRLAKKINIDAKSIKEYVGYFEDNFLVSTIHNYHTKLTEQIKSAKKLYLNDNGFLNLGVNRSLNNGTRLENWVFTILNKREKELTYIKEAKEIDFYSDNVLYQVTYDMESEQTKKREIEAFSSFSKISKNYCLITFDTKETLAGIEVKTIDEFLFTL